MDMRIDSSAGRHRKKGIIVLRPAIAAVLMQFSMAAGLAQENSSEDVTETCDQLREDLKSITYDYDNKKIALDVVQERSSELNAMKDALVDRIADLTDEIVQLPTEIGNDAGEDAPSAESLTADLQQASDQLVELQAQIASIEGESYSLRSEVSSLGLRDEDLRGKLTELDCVSE
jgi:chromosome segregation ATPase